MSARGSISLIGGSKKVPRKTYTPVLDFIAVHIYLASETSGGIQLPDNAQGSWESIRGLVIAVGPDVKQVKEGDEVLFPGSLMALKVRWKDQETLHVQEKHCIGVILAEERGGGIEE